MARDDAYLRGNEHLLAVSTFFHPFTEPFLGLLVLTEGHHRRQRCAHAKESVEDVLAVGSVDEIPAGVVERVEELETTLFVH